MKKRSILFILSALVILFVAYEVINQVMILHKAHSTFENYYAFRGCSQLVTRTTSYGLCKLPSGQTIKIVEFRGKWYLANDLPFCFGNTCL